MCSIMGYCGPVVDLDKFKEGFQRTISRGPDDSRIVDTGNGLLGFHRLAIMGLTPSGMQPFQLDGSYVVCNGEIYGFEKIKEELSVVIFHNIFHVFSATQSNIFPAICPDRIFE